MPLAILLACLMRSWKACRAESLLCRKSPSSERPVRISSAKGFRISSQKNEHTWTPIAADYAGQDKTHTKRAGILLNTPFSKTLLFPFLFSPANRGYHRNHCRIFAVINLLSNHILRAQKWRKYAILRPIFIIQAQLPSFRNSWNMRFFIWKHIILINVINLRISICSEKNN